MADKLEARVRKVVEMMGGARKAAPLLHVSYNGLLAYLAGTEKIRDSTLAVIEKYIDEAAEAAKTHTKSEASNM